MISNKKGMTLIEIIVTITLLGIVLLFLMNLFLKVRNTYNKSSVQADYNMLVATMIKAIGNDIDDYGLYSVEYENLEKRDAIILTFNSFRPSNLSERIKKIVRVEFKNNEYYISYSYESAYTKNITSMERISGVIREMPDGVYVDKDNYLFFEKSSLGRDDIVKICIPMENEFGNVYDINVYGLIKKDEQE